MTNSQPSCQQQRQQQSCVCAASVCSFCSAESLGLTLSQTAATNNVAKGYQQLDMVHMTGQLL